MSLIQNVSISGTILSWSGPIDTCYNIYGIDNYHTLYRYYENIQNSSVMIYSPDITVIPEYITSFVITCTSGNTTVSSDIYPFVLSSLAYQGSNVIGGYYAPLASTIIIPGLHNRVPITTIGQDAFNGYTTLQNVWFTSPTRISTIGIRAFRGCTGLTNILLPDCITSLGAASFQQCSSVTSIYLPNNLRTIGNYAFDSTSLISITIPINVSMIGEYVCKNCNSLTTLTFVLPSSVTTIGQYAFDNCISMSGVIIPKSVQTIGRYAFDAISNMYFEGNVPAFGTDTDDITFGSQGSFYSFFPSWSPYVSVPNGFRSIAMTSIPSIPPPTLSVSSYITDVSSIRISISGSISTLYNLYHNNIFYISGVIDSSNTYITIKGVSDGSYTYKATLQDTTTGIISPYDYLRPIVVDTISPMKPTLYSNTGLYSDSSSILFTISGEASTIYILYANGVPSISGDISVFGNATAYLTNLSNNVYTFYTQLMDAAGNQSIHSDSILVTILTTPPSAPVFVPIPSQSTETITISGAVGLKYILRMTGLPDISGVFGNSPVSYSYSNLLYSQSYTLSVTCTDLAGNRSPTTSTTWMPAFVVYLSGETLQWNGPSLTTYSIYGVNADSSTYFIGNSYYPTYSITAYSGINMSYRIKDSNNIQSSIYNVLISIDSSVFTNVEPYAYLTKAFFTNTSSDILKTVLTTYSSSFTSPVISISGINCSSMIDFSSSLYPSSYYANRTFTFVMSTSGNPIQLSSVILPQDAIIYFAVPNNTNVKYTIDYATTVQLELSNQQMTINNSRAFSLGDVFPFGQDTYRIVSFSSIAAIRYTLKTPTNVSMNGTILSWSGTSPDATYNIYDASMNTLVVTTLNTSYNLSLFVYNGAAFYVIAVAPGGEVVSSPSPSVVYSFVPQSTPPTKIVKPMSKKAIRASLFPSSSMRTKALAGREIIRSYQTGAKRMSGDYDIHAAIAAGRIYIRNNPHS